MNRLLRWWRGRRLLREAAALVARLDGLEARARKRERRRQLLESRFLSIVEEIASDEETERRERASLRARFEELQRVVTNYEGEITRLKTQAGVHEETIKGLVAANRLVLERYDADTATQVRRQVSVSG